jgi:hypothetical protein
VAVEAKEASMKPIITRLALVLAVAFLSFPARAADRTAKCVVHEDPQWPEYCVCSPAMAINIPAEKFKLDLAALETTKMEFSGDAPEFALTKHAPDYVMDPDVPTVHAALVIPAAPART